jgi:hypothetical protein
MTMRRRAPPMDPGRLDVEERHRQGVDYEAAARDFPRESWQFRDDRLRADGALPAPDDRKSRRAKRNRRDRRGGTGDGAYLDPRERLAAIGTVGDAAI